MSEIDSLLDSTLDDLEDLPSFKPFPAGAHRVNVSLSIKKINDAEAVEMSLVLLETMEMADAQAEPAKPGDTSSVLFMLNNEFGLGNLKKCCIPLSEALETSSIRETIEAAQNVECVVLTALRADKNDKDKFYLNIKELQVA